MPTFVFPIAKFFEEKKKNDRSNVIGFSKTRVVKSVKKKKKKTKLKDANTLICSFFLLLNHRKLGHLDGICGNYTIK